MEGTLGMLVPGLFEGTMTVADLLKHGDWGIGTASGLDGEMILLDHVPYLAQSNGEIRILKPEEKVPLSMYLAHSRYSKYVTTLQT